MNNPLLSLSALPLFSEIKPKHIVPAITKIIQNCHELIENLVTKNLSEDIQNNWYNFCQPLLEAEDYLDRIISIINHLNNVKNNLELRKEYEISLRMISEHISWINQHEELYKKYYELKNNINFNKLNKPQQKSIDNILLEFRLSGINLSKNQQKNYAKINMRLSELSIIYSNNILDSTMNWNKNIINDKELVGIPKSTLEDARKNAISQGKKGWVLTLDLPIYISVMTYSENIHLRKEMYTAYSTRASNKGPNAGKWDNEPIMLEILTLRYKLSKLLGFKSFAEKSLVKKMLKNPDQVMNFLNTLIKKVLPKGQSELNELINFTKKKYNINKLNPWDLYFYSEKQKQHLHHINDEKLRVYFPEKRVIEGLFEIVKKIYGFSIKERFNINVWHRDVRFFDLFDEYNTLRGSFYLDLYIRKNKRDGAWMDECTTKMRKIDGSLQIPVAYLICNFAKSVEKKQILFNHNEVITLFHEFGHCLQHILTNIDIKNLSGINGVPWDAVELSSQIMEKWCWEYESISLISCHYKNNKNIPKKTLDNMILGKNFHSALFLLRQLELCLFDFYLHMEFNPLTQNNNQILKFLYKARKKVMLLKIPKWDRFPNSFSHIFVGGYAAGYYSYLWADMLASNVFSKFKKEGIFNKNTGKKFLNNILSTGGLEEPMNSIKEFLGHDITLDSILESYGINSK